MSTSVSSSTSAQTLQALYKQSRSDFSKMVSDVKSGDLKDAQSALSSLQQVSSNIQGLLGTQGSQQYSQLQTDFANLVSNLQSGITGGVLGALQSAQQAVSGASATGAGQAAGATVSSPAQTSLGQDLAALIQDIQAGNIKGAQQDLSQLQSGLPGLGGGMNHHHHAIVNSPGLGDANAGNGASSNSSGSNGSNSAASAYASMMAMQTTSAGMTAFA